MIVSVLPSLSVLVASGVDRVAFLQGQMTLDVAGLAADATALGAFLTPAGRAVAVPRLVVRDEAILLIVPTEVRSGLKAHLSRYVLRTKVRLLESGEELAVAAVVADSATDLERTFGPGPETGHARLADGTSLIRLGSRALLIGPGEILARHVASPELDAGSAWERAALAAGEPTVLTATSEVWTPQMLNLDLLGAISFTKGCYTGQEIVARTQHLGRIKRRMFRYRAPSAVSIAPGEPMSRAGAKVGEVVRAAAGATDTELLAVVGLEAQGQPLESARGVRFEPVALPYPVG